MQALSVKKLISPKCLAQAIGVSESSLKRWADQGLLSVTRTAGGHRRISIGEAVTFIRSRKLQLVNPSAIGLSQQSIATNLSPAELDDLFLEHLVHARSQDAWDLLMSKFLQGMSIAEVGDGPMKSALRSLGSQWDHDPKGILIEHRATDLCIQLVQQMRVLATSATPSFRSTGAAISNDPYVLPSLLAASVIAEHGGDVTNLGPHTPIEVLRLDSVEKSADERPALVWMSISVVEDPKTISRQISEFAHQCHDAGILLSIGGRAVSDLSLDHVPGLGVYGSLAGVAKLANSIASGTSDYEDLAAQV